MILLLSKLGELEKKECGLGEQCGPRQSDLNHQKSPFVIPTRKRHGQSAVVLPKIPDIMGHPKNHLPVWSIANDEGILSMELSS
jgi:hypothetical protein